jgi:hypothetical protein
LIVATPRPPIVFGELRQWAPKLMGCLAHGVELRFEPEANEARVYLSGDSHHYARHSVERSGEPSLAERAVAIVCGLGGASMHPPRRGGGNRPAKATFPPVDQAHKSTLKRLLNPGHMIGKTGFGGFGAIVGFFVGAGMGAFDGEPAGLLRRLGWLRFGPTSRFAPTETTCARTIAALAGFVLGLIVFSLLYRWRFGQEKVARATSKFARSTWVALGVVLSAWVGLLMTRIAGTCPPGPVGMFDATVYAIVLLIGLGLGRLMLFLSDDSKAVPPLRRALIVAMGSMTGSAIVISLGFVVRWGLEYAGSVPAIAAFVEAASEPGVLGFVLYSLLSIGAGSAGAILGYVLVPVVYGWLVAALYGLGHHQTFAGSLALIDRYRSFVRFRLRHYIRSRHTELTGFVIGVTEPSAGQEAPMASNASLVDTFFVTLPDDPDESRVAAPTAEAAAIALERLP